MRNFYDMELYNMAICQTAKKRKKYVGEKLLDASIARVEKATFTV